MNSVISLESLLSGTLTPQISGACEVLIDVVMNALLVSCLHLHARPCGVRTPRHDYSNLGHCDLRDCSPRECALEATGVFRCRNAKDAKEGAAHRVCRFEATGIGHLFESARGTIDDLLRRFDAHTINELAGVHSSLAEADAREMAGAHTNTLGERFDSKVFAKVLEHPYLKLAQWLRGDGLMRKHVAVLCLSARTYKEHDEETRDLESCFVPVIFFDQGEREVDAGGDTCRCVDRAVAQVNWLGPHNDFGVFLGKTVAEVPVRNGLLPVEETCFCEKECAGTDGCDAT